jgi:hypothetical protein
MLPCIKQICQYVTCANGYGHEGRSPAAVTARRQRSVKVGTVLSSMAASSITDRFPRLSS